MGVEANRDQNVYEVVFTVSQEAKPLSPDGTLTPDQIAAIIAKVAPKGERLERPPPAPVQEVPPYQLITGHQSTGAGGSVPSVLVAGSPQRIVGTVSVAAVRYAGESINDDYAERFANFDVVWFVACPLYIYTHTNMCQR